MYRIIFGRNDNDMFRQGDVLLQRVKDLPSDARRILVKSDHIVLASGRATGHSHVIKSEFAQLFRSGVDTFVEVVNGAELLHEEHFAISLPAGVYRVLRQREFDPRDVEKTRYVHD